jgi:lipopolysaccharide heptosyltransferase II
MELDGAFGDGACQEPASPGMNGGRNDQRPPLERRLAALELRRGKRLVQRILWVALATVGRATSVRLGSQRPLRAGDPAIRRILVVRVDLIGDVVLSLPAARALRRAYPEAHLDMLVLPTTAGVLAGERDWLGVITFDPNIWRRPLSLLDPTSWRTAVALFRRLRTAQYDLCLNVSGDWGSVLARLSGARRRVGYDGEAYPGFMTDPVPGGRYRVRKHEVEYVLALARAAGGLIAGADALPTLRVAPEGAASVERLLARMKMGGDCSPVVVLHAGAQNGHAKRWPFMHWAALADHLTGELGARVILTGSAADAPLTAAICRLARRPVIDLAGRTSLPELVALLERCDLLVSGDSGPLHIAGALGTSVVGLYGPTDPTISGPLAQEAIVLRRAIWCAPCYDARATAVCRFHNPVCMKGLPPVAVYTAARRLLTPRLPTTALARGPATGDEQRDPAIPTHRAP